MKWKIKILGKDINEYSLAELRNVITYVPQDSYLFEGTIAENIAFGWNEETAPVMDVIVSAAKKHMLMNLSKICQKVITLR